MLKKGVASESWYKTEGTIISSDISIDYSEGDELYGAHVEYRYKVDDVDYTSDNISFGDYNSSSKKPAQKILAKYYVGKTVVVYYNPEKPSEALLEPGTTIFHYLIILLGLLPIITAISVFYFSVIRKKTKKIEIILEKSDFLPGETIKGRIRLIFNKPVMAENLKVSLLGEKIVSGGREGDNNETIFCSEIVLDRKNQYFNNTYPFEIKIPEDILGRMENWTSVIPYGWAKKVAGVSKELGLIRMIDKYSIRASLEIRGKIDVRECLEIKIS